MTEWYVYILICRDGTLYTGMTNDLQSRIDAHNNGKGAKYTRSRAPVTLGTFFVCASKSDALKKEAAIKKLSRQEKLELINNQTKTGSCYEQ